MSAFGTVPSFFSELACNFRPLGLDAPVHIFSARVLGAFEASGASVLSCGMPRIKINQIFVIHSACVRH